MVRNHEYSGSLLNEKCLSVPIRPSGRLGIHCKFAYSAVPEYIHTHPLEGQWKVQKGRRSKKAKILKENIWDGA